MGKSVLNFISILALVMVLFVAGCSEKSVPQAEEISEEVVEEVSPETTDVVAETEESEVVVAPPTGGESSVRVLGKEGFDNLEMNINVGDTVVFKNADPAEKVMVLVFQSESTRKVTNSEAVAPGTEYSKTFGEAGTYNYWTEGYGIRAKVVVQ